MNKLRLGLNIDHVATVRNARGGSHPDPVRAAIMAQNCGVDGITAHLREDRRHISDADIERLKKEVSLPLNLEMAATGEMLEIALRTEPNAVCIVPEKRQEVTTEGGLDVAGNQSHLSAYTQALKAKNIRVSLFVDPEESQIDAAKAVGADIVELHTGTYCEVEPDSAAAKTELLKLQKATDYAAALGLEVHAGHGLRFDNVQPVAAISALKELNIGHFLIGEAIFKGLEPAVFEMRSLIDAARK